MPRTSGHRSHGEHKNGERLDSQEDWNSRDRKEKVEEGGGGSRISRGWESEKGKSSSLPWSSQGKDQSSAVRGNVPVEHGRKRKDRAEDSVATDRWKGDRGDDDVANSEPKGGNFGPSESKKTAKSKLSAVDSKERSDGRREGYTERFEDSSSKVESTKRRSEKDLSRDSNLRESSSQYKDAKEKGRERGLERDKKTQESRHGRSDDAGTRNQGSKTGCSKEERVLKKDKEISGMQIQDEGHWDERHKHGRYKGKYRECLDRDQRHQDDRHRDEHSSRDYASDRADSKHHRDENKTSESRYKESKLQDSDRARPEYFHSNKIASNQNNKRPKSSSSSSVHAAKNQSSTRQAEPTHQGLPLGDRDRRSAAYLGDLAGISRGCDRTSDSRCLKRAKTKDHINSGDSLVETSSQHDKIRKSDGQSQSIQLTEISQSTNGHQLLYRSSTRRSIDIEDVAIKGSYCKDKKDYSTVDGREQELVLKNLVVDNYSRAESNGHVRLGPPFNQNGNFPESSPGHYPPPPPVMHGDLSTGKGQGDAWKSTPTWPSPVANGFMPLQHGLMPPGFPSAMQRFPAPSLFGMRPSMDVTHDSVSYHMHGTAGHVRPFGWHNPMEDSCPQLQGWDGSSGVLGDDFHVYGRQEWDHQNGHLMGSRGWWMDAGMWKGQNENLNIEIPQPQKVPDYSSHSLPDKGWTRQSSNQSHSEQVLSESTEIKRSNDAPPSKKTAEAPPKAIYEKTPIPSKTAADDCSRFCCNYLSNLDISVDLASPKLYKQCLTLLGTSDPGVCNISKHGYHQNINDENKVVKKSPINILGSLFPANSEAIFQRAMSLYKKQHEVAKAMFPLVTDLRVEKASPGASDADKVEVVEDQLPEEILSANPDSCRSIEEGSNLITETKDNVPGVTIQQQDPGDNVPGDANAQGDLYGDAKEQHSAVVSDAVVVFGDGSQACEAVMLECRVNLSRIPISPESTH